MCIASIRAGFLRDFRLARMSNRGLLSECKGLPGPRQLLVLVCETSLLPPCVESSERVLPQPYGRHPGEAEQADSNHDPRQDSSGAPHIRSIGRELRKVGPPARPSLYLGNTMGPWSARSVSLSRKRASTATTAAPRSSRARCATPAWR